MLMHCYIFIEWLKHFNILVARGAVPSDQKKIALLAESLCETSSQSVVVAVDRFVILIH